MAFVWVSGAQQVDRGLWGAAGSGVRVRPSGKAGRERLCHVCSVQGALYGGCATVGLGSGETSPSGLSVSGIGMGSRCIVRWVGGRLTSVQFVEVPKAKPCIALQRSSPWYFCL